MRSRKKQGLTLFVELGQDQSRFLCAIPSRDRSKSSQLEITSFGEVESNKPLDEISTQLATSKQRPKNLVLLLNRVEFEVHLFQLPEVDEDDIPQVVQNLVAEAVDSLEFTTDFILNSRNDSGGQNALTWTLGNSDIDAFKADAKSHGMQLSGITSRAIGSIALWRSLVQARTPHAVIATISSGSIDFAVIYNHEVTHIRTIPFASNDMDQITARLISELQRTVAVIGDAEESDSTRIYLFGAVETRKPIAEKLTEEFDVPVSILNPVDKSFFRQQALDVSNSEEYSHLIGAAKAHFFDQLDIDLLSPKRAVEKTLPWRRIATWALIVLSVAGIGGFLIWDGAMSELDEIAEKRGEFDDLALDAIRVLEMKDELAAIRAWRSTEVVWLDHLDALSAKLPPREQTVIRRITMSVADDGTSRIDLSVEVANNELVADLEQAIREEENQIVSKRVSESSGRSGERWNFETSIRFQAAPPKLSFIKPEEIKPGPSHTEGVSNQPPASTTGIGQDPTEKSPSHDEKQKDVAEKKQPSKAQVDGNAEKKKNAKKEAAGEVPQ